ncbi:S41 family peptidase [Litorilituus sediminis]|nr:S41 family peptidase [Litorilituus sediminis]
MDVIITKYYFWSYQIANPDYSASNFLEIYSHGDELTYAEHIASVNLYSEKVTEQASYLHKPIAILSSAFTQGSGEFIAYDLQKLRGALVIGEATMGVSYWFDEVELNEQLILKLPVASVHSSTGNESWQDNGVIPDKAMPANLALDYVINNYFN